MLYQKKSEKELSRELFQSPTSEYRGTPFWSWNTNLEKDELLWQIDQLKEMGLEEGDIIRIKNYELEYWDEF